MTRQHIRFIALTLLSLLIGCDSFDPGSLIRDTRVLGARVELLEDPQLAEPRPGDSVAVRWLTITPSERPVLRWAFLACLAGGQQAEPCVGEPLGLFEGEGQLPELTLAIPAAEQLGDADSLLLIGVICAQGTPELEAHGEVHCAGPSVKEDAVMLTVHVARTGQQNRNPSLDGARVELDGKPLPTVSDERLPNNCADDGSLPQIEADGKQHTLTIQLASDPREQYQDDEGRANVREQLQLSHFSTAGELERQYTFIEPSASAARPSASQKWTAPKQKDVPAGGKLVRIVTVLRDLRGGFAASEHQLCAVR